LERRVKIRVNKKIGVLRAEPNPKCNIAFPFKKYIKNKMIGVITPTIIDNALKVN
jgi:hypothetical protein